MTNPKPKGKPRGLKGGRKKLGEERGGLVPGNVQLFADQKARLDQEGQGKGRLVRAAVDKLIAQLDQSKENTKKEKYDKTERTTNLDV